MRASARWNGVISAANVVSGDTCGVEGKPLAIASPMSVVDLTDPAPQATLGSKQPSGLPCAAPHPAPLP